MSWMPACKTVKQLTSNSDTCNVFYFLQHSCLRDHMNNIQELIYNFIYQARYKEGNKELSKPGYFRSFCKKPLRQASA